MHVADWLAHAIADAEARGLSGLKPLLEGLARSTQALRDADAEFHHPAGEQTPHGSPDDGDATR
jgi:IS5 family transposase